jgi:hypothetical protein
MDAYIAEKKATEYRKQRENDPVILQMTAALKELCERSGLDQKYHFQVWLPHS